MIGFAEMSGGGPLVGVLLFFNIPVVQAAATSSYIRVWITLLGNFLHWSTMQINWHIVIFMTLESALGSLCAPFALRAINQRHHAFIFRVMKPIIACILLYMGIKPFI